MNSRREKSPRLLDTLYHEALPALACVLPYPCKLVPLVFAASESIALLWREPPSRLSPRCRTECWLAPAMTHHPPETCGKRHTAGTSLRSLRPCEVATPRKKN